MKLKDVTIRPEGDNNRILSLPIHDKLPTQNISTHITHANTVVF